MSIEHMTEKEMQLTTMLQNCTLALKVTTAERDALQAKYLNVCKHVVKVECAHGETLGELASARKERDALRDQVANSRTWHAAGFTLLRNDDLGVMFKLGAWWADRPWRVRT